MIIVQSQAEERLTETLDSLRKKADGKRCLWLELSSLPEFSLTMLQAVVAEACRLFKNEECLLFSLETHGVVIISEMITQEQAELFYHAVQTTLETDLPPEALRLYDLTMQWGRVALLTEQACSEKHARITQRKQEEAQKKREQMLNMQFDPALLDTMRKKRKVRQQLEVMVVEDDMFSRRMVRNVLDKHVRLSTAEDGASALANYTTVAPDVIFLDIELPDITGHDICRKLMEIDPDAYIVMLSGNGDRENITRAIEQGAKGFVGKPFTREKLLQYIQRCPAARQSA